MNGGIATIHVLWAENESMATANENWFYKFKEGVTDINQKNVFRQLST